MSSQDGEGGPRRRSSASLPRVALLGAKPAGLTRRQELELKREEELARRTPSRSARGRGAGAGAGVTGGVTRRVPSTADGIRSPSISTRSSSGYGQGSPGPAPRVSSTTRAGGVAPSLRSAASASASPSPTAVRSQAGLRSASVTPGSSPYKASGVTARGVGSPARPSPSASGYDGGLRSLASAATAKATGRSPDRSGVSTPGPSSPPRATLGPSSSPERPPASSPLAPLDLSGSDDGLGGFEEPPSLEAVEGGASAAPVALAAATAAVPAALAAAAAPSALASLNASVAVDAAPTPASPPVRSPTPVPADLSPPASSPPAVASEVAPASFAPVVASGVASAPAVPVLSARGPVAPVARASREATPSGDTARNLEDILAEIQKVKLELGRAAEGGVDDGLDGGVVAAGDELAGIADAPDYGVASVAEAPGYGLAGVAETPVDGVADVPEVPGDGVASSSVAGSLANAAAEAPAAEPSPAGSPADIVSASDVPAQRSASVERELAELDNSEGFGGLGQGLSVPLDDEQPVLPSIREDPSGGDLGGDAPGAPSDQIPVALASVEAAAGVTADPGAADLEAVAPAPPPPQMLDSASELPHYETSGVEDAATTPPAGGPAGPLAAALGGGAAPTAPPAGAEGADLAPEAPTQAALETEAPPPAAASSARNEPETVRVYDEPKAKGGCCGCSVM